jgi:hypothetical protein
VGPDCGEAETGNERGGLPKRPELHRPFKGNGHATAAGIGATFSGRMGRVGNLSG